ncbi:hypothetical protein EF294_14785 [Gordonia oryzae]|uniref:Septum formation-related domain-containing protein n=1 Tax=Gordonia oryzae TaxID=2487349 RepID=A0A3N4H1K2_9ACTN|nr:hypothetical protein [Gordonia oryzae]RPA59074.1 hypothetical protein EF294_14785 [Gordonia oryzae]
MAHRFSRAAAALAVATLALALAACSDSGPAAESSSTSVAASEAASTTQTTTALNTTPSGTSATGNTTPATCTTIRYPSTGLTGTIVVNEGALSCAEAITVIDRYLTLPSSSTGGNARYAEFDGWSCASPTAASSQLQGIGTECSRGTDSIRVVTPGGSTQPHQVSLAYYARPNGNAYQFSVGNGFWRCTIYAEETRPLAGCSGTMPTNAPPVLNPLRTKMVSPNGVEVGDNSAGRFIASGDPKYFPQGADGGFSTGTDLPAGHALSVNQVTCTALSNGVRCENRSANHGFEVTETNYRLW